MTNVHAQGIEDILQEWKLHKSFSRMLTKAKIFQELFTPILNRISVRVWNVFFTPDQLFYTRHTTTLNRTEQCTEQNRTRTMLVFKSFYKLYDVF